MELRNRRRLLESALSLLAHEGWRDDLLLRACEHGDVPLQSAQTFFPGSESIILALYLRLVDVLEEFTSTLPAARVSDRFAQVIGRKLELLEEHRISYQALFAQALTRQHELGVLNQQTSWVRERMISLFRQVIAEADDRSAFVTPNSEQQLYALHLLIVLAWTQFPADSSATRTKIITLATQMVDLLAVFKSLPISDPTVSLIQSTIEDFLGTDRPATRSTSRTILRTIFRHRRLLPYVDAESEPECDQEPTLRSSKRDESCQREPCERCLSPHEVRVDYFVERQEPILCLLPGFPAKSSSRAKTLGPLPDQAEWIGLRYLGQMIEDVQRAYPPGLSIIICSDGHVFSDVVHVTDSDVDAYLGELQLMLDQLAVQSIRLFSLKDLYDLSSPEMVREQLIAHYARDTEHIAHRAKRSRAHRSQLNGIERFLFEEEIAESAGRSRTQIRQECHARAIEVVRRSDAWDRLLRDCFPQAIRLSIHPQYEHSDKIGVLLGCTNDAWVTPWHSAAVRQGDEWMLMKVAEAQLLGAQIVVQEGHPYYLELPRRRSNCLNSRSSIAYYFANPIWPTARIR